MTRRTRRTRAHASGPRLLPRALDYRAVSVAIALAALAAAGWFLGAVGLAVVVAAQLGVAGLAAPLLLGPALAEGGIARYFVLPLAAVAATLFGRILMPGAFTPLAALAVGGLLWLVLGLERRAAAGSGARWASDLVLAAIVFMSAAGIDAVLGGNGWPPPLAVLGVVAGVLGLRAAEARGADGADAVGQAALHGLAVAQVAAGLGLLDLPGLVVPALIGLAFYAWSGAADALQARASARAVALEFGALAVLGIVVAYLVQAPPATFR